MPPKSSKMVMFGKNFGGQYNINIKTCAQLRVSKKLCILFLSELCCQISTNFNKFWYVDDKVVGIVVCYNVYIHFHLT